MSGGAACLLLDKGYMAKLYYAFVLHMFVYMVDLSKGFLSGDQSP